MAECEHCELLSVKVPIASRSQAVNKARASAERSEEQRHRKVQAWLSMIDRSIIDRSIDLSMDECERSNPRLLPSTHAFSELTD